METVIPTTIAIPAGLPAFGGAIGDQGRQGFHIGHIKFTCFLSSLYIA